MAVISVDALVAEAGATREPVSVTVPTGSGAYPVVVGPGALARLPGLLPPGVAKVAVVTQDPVGVDVDTGREQRVFTIPDGEPAKTLATVEALCRAWARWGLGRGDAVVAVGGGVVTDTAGFAAAVYHRGVPVLHVATTLLAQVDAAVGGKTGVNLPEGKNLVGAFWQPVAVVCDTALLARLPERELRSGLGEVAKYHFLAGGETLHELAVTERVARCVEIKARYVAADEREDPSGGPGRRRTHLNYGHTLAHALETAGSYDLRHGEAVGIGLVFAAVLARRLGRVNEQRVREHREVVEGYGLPTRLPPDVDAPHLLELFGRDKKAVRGVTFVLDGPAGLEDVAGVPNDEVVAALGELR